MEQQYLFSWEAQGNITAGLTVVTPINSGMSVKGYRDGYRRREKIDGSILLGDSDYQYMKSLLNENPKINVTLNRRIDGVWRNRARGYFYLKTCKWDYDKCTVEISVSELDDYSQLLLKQDRKINIMGAGRIFAPVKCDIVTTQYEYFEETIEHTYGIGHFRHANSTQCWRFDTVPLHPDTGGYLSSQPNLPTYSGWQALEVQLTVPNYGSITFAAGAFPATIEYNTVPVPATILVKYIREIHISYDGNAPSGVGWVNIGTITLNELTCTKYARKPYDAGVSPNPWTYTYIGTQYCTPTPLCYGTNYSPSGAMEYGEYWGFLKNAINYILQVLSDDPYNPLHIKSDLLFSNADPVHSGANLYYNTSYALHNGRHRMLCFAGKSDVILINPTEVATKIETSFKEVMDILSAMFNGDWCIEGNNVVFEHVSYFENSNHYPLTGNTNTIIDLRNETSAQCSAKFTFDNSKNRNRTQFSMGEADGIDFIGADIIHNATFGQDKEIAVTVDISGVTTDLAFIYGSPSEINNSGLCLAVIELPGSQWNDYEIVNYAGAITNTEVTNGLLCWATLHDLWYRHSQPFASGQLNFNTIAFNSVLKLRKQDPIHISNCAMTFSATNRYQTSLGVGEVYEYSENLDDGDISLTLHYPT